MKKYKNKLICLLGFSGCGKDTIARILEKKEGFKFVVSHTDRPMRSGEQQDIQYHFCNKDIMDYYIKNNEFIEYREYNTIYNSEPSVWRYGIAKNEIDLDKKCHVACVDLDGYKSLLEYFGEENVISIFIDVDYNSRLLRAMARDNNFEEAEFERRYEDDKIKLKDIEKSVNYIVDNYYLDDCLQGIKYVISKYSKR